MFLKDKMGLKMKNFNILGIHWRVWLLWGEFTKNWYREGNCLKRGAGKERVEWCFWRERGGGGLRPRCTLWNRTHPFTFSLFLMWLCTYCYPIYNFWENYPQIWYSFFLIAIHSMQGWTATTWHGVTRNRNKKKIKAHRKFV